MNARPGKLCCVICIDNMQPIMIMQIIIIIHKIMQLAAKTLHLISIIFSKTTGLVTTHR